MSTDPAAAYVEHLRATLFRALALADRVRATTTDLALRTTADRCREGIADAIITWSTGQAPGDQTTPANRPTTPED